MHEPPHILVVDDTADSREIIRMRLAEAGYRVSVAVDGAGALEQIATAPPDLVLLDVMMPGIDGIETLRRIKADQRLGFLPVILLTARGDDADIVAGLEAGADDYLAKPIWHTALLARVRAMLRIKRLQDQLLSQTQTLAAQAAALAAWNSQLEQRVAEQVAATDRVSRLKRFLAPQVVDAILGAPDGEAVLESHRREVAVLFCDLRGFTGFAETAESEDVIALLGEYHQLVGELVFDHGGTLERFVGDAIMVFFNDPVPTPDFCRSAAALGTDILAKSAVMTARWRNRGVELGIGIGIAAGYATLGTVGFRHRVDYAAIGTVTNLASRLSSRAEAGQILINARLADAVGSHFQIRSLGKLDLQGFSRPTPIYQLSG